MKNLTNKRSFDIFFVLNRNYYGLFLVKRNVERGSQMKKLGFILVSGSALVLLGACSNQGEETTDTANQNEELAIVTTFYPVYDFTKHIVGDEGDVSLMVPAGTEPHDYEPSAKDMAKINDADVFIYHNENMETWVPQAEKGWEEGAPNVIKGTEDMLLLAGSEEEHDHEEGEDGHTHELDPHTWLSPKKAIDEVNSITNQLSELYPEKQTVFEENAAEYVTELESLDQEYSDSLNEAKQTSFVTQHAAFGYLALDYGLTQVPITGLSPEEEPSPSRLAELKDYVADNEIHYIYYEENTNDKIAQTLADEANVQTAVLNPLESLTDEQIEAGEDYISVMEDNLASLEKTTTVAGKEIQAEDAHSEETVANGYFDDQDVKDRALSDYVGEWQSVYPLLEDGTLDPVFEYKAKLNQEMTEEEYKEYYDTGYQTDVATINIEGDTIDFVVDGESHKYTYEYQGYEILEYEKGNRGVRYLFETNDDAGQFKYVQFSDHNIAPVEAEHFHIFFGENEEDVLAEMDNWPTYYPKDLSGEEIAQEMMAH